MEKRSTFIRDLLVKILLIALFLFLLMYLFPMPNLTPFYSAIFNNNIQTMKDAAEDYYTVKRMPTEDGKSVKMTLKEMEEKKLIIPFVDKDGKSCDKKKSYVMVTKDGDEYVLKVSLTCSGESNYIIERIGCHDFCANGVCNVDKPISELPKEEKEVVCKTEEDGTITVKVPTGEYVKELEYKKENYSETWTTGDWKTSKETETSDVKLVNTRTRYTGQKKVTTNTTLYEQVAYEYKDNWTLGEWKNTTETETETHRLYSKRTLYTGQKLETTTVPRYQYSKTKYVLTKTISTPTTVCSDWKNDSTWYSSKPSSTSSKVYGDSYNSKSTTNWKLIQSSYRSVNMIPAIVESNGSTYKYELVNKADNNNCGSNCSATSIIYYYNVYKAEYSYQYQYKYKTCEASTTSSVDTKTVYKKADSDNLVKQGYTLKSKTVEDTMWSDSATAPANYEFTGEQGTHKVNKYISLGKWVTNKDMLGEYTYNISTTVQYKYATNNRTKTIKDTKWTTENVATSGYVLTGNKKTTSKTTYIDLGKWVNSKSELGEYTYNIKTLTEYKYKYRKVNKSVEYKWVKENENPGEGWVATGRTKTTYVQTGYKTITKSVKVNKQK